MTTAAIVLAGGSGSRARDDVNKVYLPIGGRPLLSYSLETVDACTTIDTIVLVARASDWERAEGLTAGMKTPIDLVEGGPTRRASEYEGLKLLAPRIESGEVDCVAIHDGARPFMSERLLEAIVSTARQVGGAIPGYPPPEPLYRVEGDLVVLPADEGVHRVQTPQAFSAPELLEAYRRADRDGFEGVDTAETVQRYSDLHVQVVPGDRRNIKVTYVEDFFVAEDLAYHWQNGTWDV
jgi:2-C-methyl-D-erythritol 4-phosphate cytidylyltransferase